MPIGRRSEDDEAASRPGDCPGGRGMNDAEIVEIQGVLRPPPDLAFVELESLTRQLLTALLETRAALLTVTQRYHGADHIEKFVDCHTSSCVETRRVLGEA